MHNNNEMMLQFVCCGIAKIMIQIIDAAVDHSVRVEVPSRAITVVKQLVEQFVEQLVDAFLATGGEQGGVVTL